LVTAQALMAVSDTSAPIVCREKNRAVVASRPMGADLIGWRECELQQSLGQRGFLENLKMKAYKRAVESQVPEAQRAKVQVAVVTNGVERELTYAQICAKADEFERGIPACATCPLSGGKQLGCYHYVTYPLDARFEEVAFEFFTSQLTTKDSISDQLYRDIVSKQPAAGSGWHTRRGPQGALARRPTPLTHSWGGFFSKKKVDSAQLMASLFVPMPIPALIVGYARFFAELVHFADAKLQAEMKQRGLTLNPNGNVKVEITEAQIPELGSKLSADADAISALVSGTFGEVRALSVMMQHAAVRSVSEGWSMLVDS
jgi:hypothetical protein